MIGVFFILAGLIVGGVIDLASLSIDLLSSAHTLTFDRAVGVIGLSIVAFVVLLVIGLLDEAASR